MKFKAQMCFMSLGAVAATAAQAGISDANAASLMAKYNCAACHTVDKKLVGPAFKDVAKKYAGDASISGKLEDKVTKGSSGDWGSIPMPPNNVPAADLNSLIEWILALK